ncbi:unnamed protein product [Brassica oleracea var. botrytis]
MLRRKPQQQQKQLCEYQTYKKRLSYTQEKCQKNLYSRDKN